MSQSHLCLVNVSYLIFIVTSAVQCNSGLPLSAELRLSLEREGGNKFYCLGPPASYLGLNNRQPQPKLTQRSVTLLSCHPDESREKKTNARKCRSVGPQSTCSPRGSQESEPRRPGEARPGQAGSQLPVIEKFDQIWFSCGRAVPAWWIIFGGNISLIPATAPAQIRATTLSTVHTDTRISRHNGIIFCVNYVFVSVLRF